MKIEFDKLDFVANAAFKGGDGAFEVKTSGDKDNKIMYGRLRKGCSIGMHRHEGTAEIIYVVSGEGVMSVEGGEEVVRPGDGHGCAEGSGQCVRNDREEPVEFFAVVPTLKG